MDNSKKMIDLKKLHNNIKYRQRCNREMNVRLYSGDEYVFYHNERYRYMFNLFRKDLHWNIQYTFILKKKYPDSLENYD